MSKLVYQPRKDSFVEVSIINLNVMLNVDNFEVIVNADSRNKIDVFLEESLNSNIICFPEYSYNAELFNVYKEFSDNNNVIIIGGSGIEQVENGFYAFCPVFIPNKDSIKVYKRYVTIEERTNSRGRLLPYPNPTERHFSIEHYDREYVFSIFICYDFLQDRYDSRSDIVFIPQYESSPRHFINEANRIVQGFDNFVIGVNNSDNSLRSVGFANLNKSMIAAFTGMKKRKKEYKDQDNDLLNEHHTIFYDIKEEQRLSFKLNLANPVPKPYNFSYSNYEPTVLIL